jgi:hypothetical protein
LIQDDYKGNNYKMNTMMGIGNPIELLPINANWVVVAGPPVITKR